MRIAYTAYRRLYVAFEQNNGLNNRVIRVVGAKKRLIRKAYYNDEDFISTETHERMPCQGLTVEMKRIKVTGNTRAVTLEREQK
jgi:hypothetical protein